MKISTESQVGQTDLYVSLIGLGTAPLANLYGSVPEDQAVETIQLSLKSGITYFDTAPTYGAGLAERRLGLALAGAPRNQYVLSTKVGRLLQPDGSFVWDFSREGVLRSIEQSLERLQCDSIDILLIHDPDNHYHQALDEAFPTLAELRSQGIVKAIGAGMNRWPMLVDFARNADFDCFMLAGRYTLLEQGALGMMDLCHTKGIGILMAGVFNSGILATGAIPRAKYNYTDPPPEIVDRVRRLETVCERYNVHLKVAALQFPLAHPATTCLVLGTSSATRLADYIAGLHVPIPSDLWVDLQEEGLLSESAPIPQAQEQNA
jgi:D-threo-aldose 1-dehydrogenase